MLLDSAAGLAAILDTATKHTSSRFVGCSDHLVSESSYFVDPEYDGIELCHDRPRSTGSWVDGRIRMEILPLDPNAFIQRKPTDVAAVETTAAPATVGHVHLKVGDVAQAHDFYVGTLGFAVTAEIPGGLSSQPADTTITWP